MNKLIDMFNMDIVKKQITDCPKDEIVILLPHYSINKPIYTDEECINEYESEDWYEMEELINYTMQVNDFDDLICDPHNILE